MRKKAMRAPRRMTFDGSGHGNGLVRAGVFFWDDSFLDLNSSRRARSGVKLRNAVQHLAMAGLQLCPGFSQELRANLIVG